MKTHYQQIKEFMQAMEQECPSEPIIPSLAIRKLRAKTILEEALERIEALGFAVVVSIDGELTINDSSIRFEELYEFSAKDFLDGVCDAEYFDLGSLMALGISEEKYMEHFEKVHQANIGKLWTRDECNKNQINPGEGYITKFITFGENGPSSDLFLVKDKDGKVTKPPSFKAPETEI